jgi:hypothetical protein
LIEDYLTNTGGQEEFNILDLGCSHGKNSMIIVNKILDQLVGNSNHIKLVNVVHEDLPDNDFEEVLRCVNDPQIGYKNHKLAKTAKLEPYTVGKSFYQVVKPTEVGPIDIAFSLNTLHWIPSKPCPVYQGLLPNSRNLTEENQKVFSEYSIDLLEHFFNYRFEEMRVGGLLIFNIHHKVNLFDAEDEIWDEHLKHHNLTNEKFQKLMMPVYCRSEAELQGALDSVKDKFEVVYLKEGTDGGPSFSIDVLKAAHKPQVINGLKQYEDHFGSQAKLEEFVEEFYQKVANWYNTHVPWVSNFWVVLKKK